MIKKIVNWLVPFWIYSLGVSCIFILFRFIPSGSDYLWLIGWGFILPHLFVGIYVWGLLLGWLVQWRSFLRSIRSQLLLTLIVFTVSLLVLSIYTWGTGVKWVIILNMIPSAGFSILFFAAEIVTKKAQMKQEGKESLK